MNSGYDHNEKKNVCFFSWTNAHVDGQTLLQKCEDASVKGKEEDAEAGAGTQDPGSDFAKIGCYLQERLLIRTPRFWFGRNDHFTAFCFVSDKCQTIH